MSAGRPIRISLIGFSGTGKSAVAPLVAQQLGWHVIDTDDLVEVASGTDVAEVFRVRGESGFRRLEGEAVRQATGQENVVISCGGGAILSSESRYLLARDTLIVCLEARLETIVSRIGQEGGADLPQRPLLAGTDLPRRIRDLKTRRQPLYALADWIVHTDGLTPDQVADEVVRVWRDLSPALLSVDHRLESFGNSLGTQIGDDSGDIAVRTSNATYPVRIGWGLLAQLGQLMKEEGFGGRAFVISDSDVFARYGDVVVASLRSVGLNARPFTVPVGEAAKSLKTVASAYDWLVGEQAERGEPIVGLGGGVVTDIAGFVAATFLRGLPLVQVPTSLLGMVDAAIGGKVGVNLPQAKNLVGSFYQPCYVLVDVSALRSLSPRQLTSGWAEVIKHAMIADGPLLELLEQRSEEVIDLRPEVTAEVIRLSIAIKADLVGRDEHEQVGPRTFLNYGHTIGHALEAATGYSVFLHGEAVAIGMTAAAYISDRLGLLSTSVRERQTDLLRNFGLPMEASGLDREKVKEAILLDKKIQRQAVRWVLLEGIGRPVIRDDVPDAVVEKAIACVSE